MLNDEIGRNGQEDISVYIFRRHIAPDAAVRERSQVSDYASMMLALIHAHADVFPIHVLSQSSPRQALCSRQRPTLLTLSLSICDARFESLFSLATSSLMLSLSLSSAPSRADSSMSRYAILRPLLPLVES